MEGKDREKGLGDRMLRALVVGSSETVLAVAIVLVLALAFMGILVLSFPEGSGLVSFYDDMVLSDEARSRLQVDRAGDAGGPIALLTGIRRRVRDRPAHAISWKPAHIGDSLGDRHTVQTLVRSAAEIAFDDANRLRLGEKSLVVVKQPERARWRNGRNASLVLLGGDVHGTVARTDRPLDIVMVGGKARILPEEGAEAEFSFKVNEDRSATLSVFSGRAEVTSGGETAVVDPDRAITVEPMQPPGEPVKISGAPQLTAPAHDQDVVYGTVAPRIEFGWSEVPDADAYRFVLARDPALLEIVYQQESPRARFIHGGLDAGTYYWQVRSLTGRADGRASPVRRLRLAEDLDPPSLELTFPEELVDTRRLVISGATEPGAEVFVGSSSIPIDGDGRFEYTLDLDPGLNMIVVEAVDAAGNSAYHSQYVSARLRAMETTR